MALFPPPIKILILALLFLSWMACQAPSPPKETSTPPPKKNRPKRKLTPQQQGRRELAAFEEKYNQQRTDTITFPPSKGAFYKAYSLRCSGECSQAVFNNRKDTGVNISEEEFLTLLTLLKAPNAYNNSTAACFDPKIGVVIYDADSIPSAFLSICLDCNNVRTHPGGLAVLYQKEQLKGFSRKARNQLRTLFFSWGIDYYGFSPFWDKERDFEHYLKKKEQ